MKNKIILFLLLLLLFLSCEEKRHIIIAENGFLDLSNWDFNKDGIAKLDGDWEFYWQKLYSTGDIDFSAQKNLDYFYVPKLWNGYKYKKEVLPSNGFATFRLKVKLNDNEQPLAIKFGEQATAIKIYVNRELFLEAGKVGKNKFDSRPDTLPMVVYLPKYKNEIEIIVEMSNFFHKSSGFWYSFELGTHEQIYKEKSNKLSRVFFIFGFIFIITLYQFLQFIFRKKDKTPLIFAIFCFNVLFRIFVTDEKLFIYLFPILNYNVYIRIEYITYFFSVPLSVHFLYLLYKNETNINILKFFYIVSFIFSLLLLLPPRYFSYSIFVYHLFFLIAVFVVMSIIYNAYKNKRDNISLVLISYFCLVIASSNDILNQIGLLNNGDIASLGISALVFFQTIVISNRYSKSLTNLEELQLSFKNTNSIYSKFVPNEFITFLNKKHITEITLGDNVNKNISIMFTDIRNFTHLSETMTPEENFKFLNSFLMRIAPCILSNKGFIDKYIGDSIMAIFPESPDNSLDAAIYILQELEIYNQHRSNNNYDKINIGIGLNYGNAVLGIMGSKEKMTSSIISKTVNIAHLMETLTKKYKIPLIINNNFINSLQNKNKYNFRMIDKLIIDEKFEALEIYEVIDIRTKNIIDKFLNTNELFYEALNEFFLKNNTISSKLFNKVLKINPHDNIAKYYLEHIESLKNN